MSQALSNLPAGTSTAGAATSASSAAGNLNTMTATDFIKLMITQLQHQDPLNPTNSNDLLTQMSQISNLQSNQSMVNNLQGLTLQQSIGAGGTLIGKTVQGLTASGQQVSGTVTSVKVQNQSVLLELDSGQEVPLNSVEQIAPAPNSTVAGAAGTPLPAAVSAAAATAAAAVPGATVPATPAAAA